MQIRHLSDLSRVTRENQKPEGFYRLEDSSVFVVSHDGEGRHWYDDLDGAVADFGEPEVIYHVHSSNANVS